MRTLCFESTFIHLFLVCGVVTSGYWPRGWCGVPQKSTKDTSLPHLQPVVQNVGKQYTVWVCCIFCLLINGSLSSSSFFSHRSFPTLHFCLFSPMAIFFFKRMLIKVWELTWTSAIVVTRSAKWSSFWKQVAPGEHLGNHVEIKNKS